MSDTASTCRYEIRVDGVLDTQWETWFEDLHIASDGRHTTISGPLADQAALHGVLIKIQRLGHTPVVRPTPRPGLILGTTPSAATPSVRWRQATETARRREGLR